MPAEGPSALAPIQLLNELLAETGGWNWHPRWAGLHPGIDMLLVERLDWILSLRG